MLNCVASQIGETQQCCPGRVCQSLTPCTTYPRSSIQDGSSHNVSTSEPFLTGNLIVNNNAWGNITGQAEGYQCMKLYDGGASWTVTYKWTGDASTVKSYPYIKVHPSNLPVPLKDISQLNINGNWRTWVTGTENDSPAAQAAAYDNVGLIANVAIDLFLAPDATASTTVGSPIEIMIWPWWVPTIHPLGYTESTPEKDTLDVNGMKWSLYHGINDPGQNVFSWLAHSNVSSMSGDYSPLIKYLQTAGYMSGDLWVGQLELGQEIKQATQETNFAATISTLEIVRDGEGEAQAAPANTPEPTPTPSPSPSPTPTPTSAPAPAATTTTTTPPPEPEPEPVTTTTLATTTTRPPATTEAPEPSSSSTTTSAAPPPSATTTSGTSSEIPVSIDSISSTSFAPSEAVSATTTEVPIPVSTELPTSTTSIETTTNPPTTTEAPPPPPSTTTTTTATTTTTTTSSLTTSTIPPPRTTAVTTTTTTTNRPTTTESPVNIVTSTTGTQTTTSRPTTTTSASRITTSTTTTGLVANADPTTATPSPTSSNVATIHGVSGSWWMIPALIAAAL